MPKAWLKDLMFFLYIEKIKYGLRGCSDNSSLLILSPLLIQFVQHTSHSDGLLLIYLFFYLGKHGSYVRGTGLYILLLWVYNTVKLR